MLHVKVISTPLLLLLSLLPLFVLCLLSILYLLSVLFFLPVRYYTTKFIVIVSIIYWYLATPNVDKASVLLDGMTGNLTLTFWLQPIPSASL